MRAYLDNRTPHHKAKVRATVTWVLRELDVDIPQLLVRVKLTPHATHYGRFYTAPRLVPRVWNEKGWTIPKPREVCHMMVCRIPDGFAMANVSRYKRGPPSFWPQDWRESLVCITAHEATHVRQFLTSTGKPRWSEVAAEWAEYRLLQRWRERK